MKLFKGKKLKKVFRIVAMIVVVVVVIFIIGYLIRWALFNQYMSKKGYTAETATSALTKAGYAGGWIPFSDIQVLLTELQ